MYIILPMKNVILRFGLLAVTLLLLLQLTNYNLVSRVWGTELMVGVFSVILIGIGVYLSRFIFKPPESADKEAINENQIKRLGISPREYEVLRQMALGRSNLEIAETLFISESTVKTHVSNLLLKLTSKRRTEAISKAQKMRVI